MPESSNSKLSAVTTTTVTIISSLIAGLLLAYFTNVLFKPDVLYTVSGSKISLPENYEKELSKIRATLMVKNFETLFGQNSRKRLSVEVGVKGKGIGIRKHELSVFGPNLVGKSENSLTVEGSNLEKMLDEVEKPATLRALLDPTVSYPTAFATVEIYNSGNREATDLEVNIIPNGILVESTVDSSEPSADKWENIVDKRIDLPVGIHLPPIKRLPPGGKIRAKLYWHLMGTEGEPTKQDTPFVNVKGSYSGGMLQFAEARPYSPINWPLWAAFGVFVALCSAVLGYWLKGYKQHDS